MDFPGTITIPAETLMDLVRSYCRSLDAHGFEHVVLVPSHGGNFAPVNTVAPEIAREIDANVIALADLDELMALMNEGLREAGVEYEEPVIHAGAAETAIVLAVAEDLVQTDELEVGHEGDLSVSRLEMILAALADDSDQPKYIETEVPYPESGKRCDLSIECGSRQLPVEVKLLRFRRDNGNIDPSMYKSIFSPFPERSSSSLLTDTRKLAESGFEPPYGLLGLYYEKNEEKYEQLSAERIAEKFEHDVEYWYNLDIDTVAVNRFSGLQHPHHQHGAVIVWVLPENPR